MPKRAAAPAEVGATKKRAPIIAPALLALPPETVVLILSAAQWGGLTG